MDLFIEITDGPLKGNRTQLRNGLTLGRRGCDVNIEDSKVSSKHAQVKIHADGSLWLIDAGSANGIRVEGQRVTELALTQGMSFRLGRTDFQVLGANERGWRRQIVELSERMIREIPVGKRREGELLPFHNVLKLQFKGGIQSGTDWILGYGPREVGSSSVDLPLFEPGLPAKCFKIVPKGIDAIIRLHEDAFGKILLNGKRVETAFLRPGDMIEIGNTRIEITFET